MDPRSKRYRVRRPRGRRNRAVAFLNALPQRDSARAVVGMSDMTKTRLPHQARPRLLLVLAVVVGLLATGIIIVNQKAARPSAVEDCEDFVFVPCPRQVATLSLPLAGSSFSLRYASDRVPGRLAAPSLDARPLGLGGWSIDVLQSYDIAAKVLVQGTGERRRVDATSLTMDGTAVLAVASEDGSAVYVFDAAGRHLQTFDAITGTKVYAFGWGPSGLDSITEPGGRVTRVRRDTAGSPIEVVAARGYRSRLGTRDGWLAAVADPSGHLTTITTRPDGLVTVLRDASDARTVLRYDDMGRLVEWHGPAGANVKLQRTDSANGFTVTATTGAGRTWSDSVRREDARVVRTHVDASGRTTTSEIEGAQRTTTAADGTIVHLKLTPDPRWGMAAPVAQQVEVASPGGRKSAIGETRTADPTATAAVPGASRRTLTVDGATWTLAFEPGGRAATVTQPDGRTRTTVFDEAGRVSHVDRPGAAAIAYAYDDHGRLERITVGAGDDARSWRYAFDAASGAVTTTDPLGRTRTTSADANGRTTAIEMSGNLTVGIEHDEVGRLSTVTPPGAGPSRFDRRPDGRVDTVTQPGTTAGPQFSTFEYDADGVLTATGAADGTATTIHRDANGRVDQVDAGPGPWHIGYDGTTGAATSFDGPGATLQRQFDGSALVGESWSGPITAVVTRRFDPTGRILAETVSGSPEIGYGYNDAGLLTQAGDVRLVRDPQTGRVSQETLGSLQRSWTYNTFGEVTALAVSSQGHSVYDLAVARDAVGRVTSRTEDLLDGTAHTRAFTYDDAGRLASVTDDGGPAATFAYDPNGNLVTETAPDGTVTTATYDGADQLISRGDTTYTYDAAGRLSSATNLAGTTTYAYDRVGVLQSVQPPSGPAIVYVNDATGRRVAREVGGQIVEVFAYADDLRPAAELDST
ncbi:MAG: RHS repeat protein, partial [Actinobacteria bacterium]|nr:RHS repeat protein [Actinomycetota bacterium]